MDQNVVAQLSHEANGAGTGPGSDEYYAARFSAPNLARRAWCGLTLKTIIEEIPLKVNDPGVARLKLAWWQDPSSRANHPLFKIAERLAVDSDTLHRAVSSLSTSLDSEYSEHGFADHAARQQWFYHAYTDIYRVIGTDLSLAAHVEQARSVLRLRDQLLNNICRLPDDLLSQHKLTSDSLLQDPHKPACQQLLLDELKDSTAQLRTALHQRTERRSPIRTYAALTEQRLAETIRDGGRLLDRKLELTPIRKVWIALRCRWF